MGLTKGRGDVSYEQKQVGVGFVGLNLGDTYSKLKSSFFHFVISSAIAFAVMYGMGWILKYQLNADLSDVAIRFLVIGLGIVAYRTTYRLLKPEPLEPTNEKTQIPH